MAFGSLFAGPRPLLSELWGSPDDYAAHFRVGSAYSPLLSLSSVVCSNRQSPTRLLGPFSSTLLESEHFNHLGLLASTTFDVCINSLSTASKDYHFHSRMGTVLYILLKKKLRNTFVRRVFFKYFCYEIVIGFLYKIALSLVGRQI